MKLLAATVFLGFLASEVKAFQCSSGIDIPDRLRCNGLAQCHDCSDEVNCPGLEDMFSCGGGPNLSANCVRKDQLCDGITDCDNCNDEKNCSNSLIFQCADGDRCVDIRSSPRCIRGDVACQYFCDGIPDCNDGSDEIQDGFGFKCDAASSAYGRVMGAPRCVIPQHYIQRWMSPGKNETAICRDEADQCYNARQGSAVLNITKCWQCMDGQIIQRRQMCDGIFDCADLSDECLCSNTNKNKICQALLAGNKCNETQVPCSLNGECISISKICDEKTDCESGADEDHCNVTRQPMSGELIHCNSMSGEESNRATKCDKRPECFGLEDECSSNCSEKPFYCNFINAVDDVIRWNNSNCTTSNTNNLCDGIINCIEDAIDEKYCPKRKLCNASDIFAGAYDVFYDSCDFVKNCKSGEDEQNCPDHFYCDGGRTFLHRTQVFDGKFDCLDSSDECQISSNSIASRTEMIDSIALNMILWIMMALALVGNTIVIVKTSKDIASMLRRRLNCTPNRVGVCNKTMILNLAISDLLTGFYLLFICAKSLEYSGQYCRSALSWLISDGCKFAGVLLMLSSQTSVLIMALMTTYRLYGVINPFRVEKIRCRFVYFAITLVWLLSFLLAIVPVLPSNESTFLHEMVVYEPYNLSTRGFPSEVIHEFTMKANLLPGASNRTTIPIPAPDPVQAFCDLLPIVCGPSRENIEGLLGYYSSESVCIPRFFPKRNEPGSVYTLSVITFDFLAFAYMFVAYFIIYRSTSVEHQGGQYGGDESGSTADLRSQENRTLWGKIVRLIITDFICWVPICCIAFASFAGAPVEIYAYSVSAIVLIPINSALNPWIYSSFLWDFVKKFCSTNKFIKRLYPRRSFHLKRRDKTRNLSDQRQMVSPTRVACFGWLDTKKVAQDTEFNLAPNSPSSTNNTNDGLTIATEL